jgi:hypothetical protein
MIDLLLGPSAIGALSVEKLFGPNETQIVLYEHLAPFAVKVGPFQ